MRFQRCIFTLAAAATLASSTAPAWAFDAGAPQGPSAIPSATPAQHGSTDSIDWVAGAGAAAALAVGGGLIVRRRSNSTSQLHLATASSRGTARTRQRRAPTA